MSNEQSLGVPFFSACDTGDVSDIRLVAVESEQRVQGIRRVDTGDFSMLLGWLTADSIAPHLKTVPQSEEEVVQFYSDPARDSFITLDLDGSPVGVFSLHKPSQEDNVCTLERFAVAPEFQKNGYGRDMLQYAIDEAFLRNKYDGIKLKVGMGVVDDERTVHFYEAAEFRATSLTYIDVKTFGLFSTIEEAEEKREEIPGNPYRQVRIVDGQYEVIAPKTEMILWNPAKYKVELGRRITL